MRKTTTYTVFVASREARVRIQNDLTDEFGIPVSAGEAEKIAVERGIKKLFGMRAFWQPDHYYFYRGQVMRHRNGGGMDALTWTVGLGVKAESEFPVDEEARAKAMRELDEFLSEAAR